MPTKKQLFRIWETEFEFPQTRREDDPMYQLPQSGKQVTMPANLSIYNGCSERCDMLVGACACGAWHEANDWDGKIGNIETLIS